VPFDREKMEALEAALFRQAVVKNGRREPVICCKRGHSAILPSPQFLYENILRDRDASAFVKRRVEQHQVGIRYCNNGVSNV
jgi:hypothetical protein